MPILEQLAQRKLIVVTGKGGVGKTTLTATLGRTLAALGRRVLLLEVDPRESLYQALDISPSGGAFVRVDEKLHVQNLSPRSVLDRLVRERLHLELIARRVLASPVYGHFVEAAPGLKELAVLGHALRVVRGEAADAGPQIDVVLLDAPASGHGMSLLEAPRLVAEIIRDGPFGKLSRELAEFVGDRDRCSVVVVTIAEELPVQETIELIESLDQRLSSRPELIAVNRLYPALDDPAEPLRDDAVAALWRRRRRVNDSELERLGRVWSGPRIDLPMLPLDKGPELIDRLARSMRDASAGSG